MPNKRHNSDKMTACATYHDLVWIIILLGRNCRLKESDLH